MHILGLTILTAVMSACSQGEKAVPRRDGYPRIAEYAAEYVAADNLPLHFEVNVNAVATIKPAPKGAVWLNVAYPAYDAEIYCTFTPVDTTTVEAVIDNRAERIHLNLGGMMPAFTDYRSDGGYHSTVAKAPAALSTPVQFISVNEDNPAWVVSGTIFFRNAGEIQSVDSVAPMVAIIQRDLAHALQRLR